MNPATLNPATLNPEWLHWPQTQKLVAAFTDAGAQMRFVGGCVRDALLGRAVQDVDAATSLPPKAVMELLKASGIKALPTGIQHGTVTAVIDGRHFEITTLRKDIACDGRHAQVVFTDDWKEDASRRDFTMNALYFSPSGELFDYFGGAGDARKGSVRFIGKARQRITEDALRILRFFRFYAHYGSGAPDADAMAACKSTASHMEKLSGERIQQEMFKLLKAPAASETLRIMHEGGILTHALGFAVTGCKMFARFDSIEQLMRLSIGPEIRLAGFVLKTGLPPQEALESLSSRLRLPHRVEKLLRVALQCQKDIHLKMTEAEQKRLIRKLGAEHFTQAVIVKWASGEEAISAAHPYAKMLALAAQWQPPVFPVCGDDLIALGITPGKNMGDVLRTLEEEWESSNYTLGREALISRLRR